MYRTSNKRIKQKSRMRLAEKRRFYRKKHKSVMRKRQIIKTLTQLAHKQEELRYAVDTDQAK